MHGRYSRAEIEAAFGVLTADAPWIHREGVLAHQATQCDLLFITLRKSKALFSLSTRTRDLALVADGDSLAAGAGDTGGVEAGDGVGGLRMIRPVRLLS